MATITSLSNQEAARTGWTHAAHVTFNDLATTASDVLDVIAVPVGSVTVDPVWYSITAWNGTTPLSDVGIAATATANAGFETGLPLDTTAGQSFICDSAATQLVNNTAARFLTMDITVTGGPSTQGEGILYFGLHDIAALFASDTV